MNERRCTECLAILPRYHRGELCDECKDSLDTDALGAELSAFERDHVVPAPPLAKREGGRISVGQATLTEARLPDSRGRDYPGILEAFMRSSLDCAKVEIAGVKSIAVKQGLIKALATVGGNGCTVALRAGDCYLVRAKRH